MEIPIKMDDLRVPPFMETFWNGDFHRGTPVAAWFMAWKKPNIDENWGYPYLVVHPTNRLGEAHTPGDKSMGLISGGQCRPRK